MLKTRPRALLVPVIITTAVIAIIGTPACHARYSDVSKIPASPRITFPRGITEGLTTNVAWFGDAHDACEIKVMSSPSLSSVPLWESTIDTPANFVRCGPLPSNTRCFAFVRLRGPGGWGNWSEPREFTTPESPTLRIDTPANASVVRGPSVNVRWTVESDSDLESLAVSLDSSAPINLDAAESFFTFERVPPGVHTVRINAVSGGRSVQRETCFLVDTPVQLGATILYTLDLADLRRANVADEAAAADAFETLHAAAALQGLVNRDRPRLYIYFTDVDRFWLEKMREPGSYLEHAQLVPLNTLDDAIKLFRDEISGVVVWDPRLPCTSNIASTICGVENLIPVRGTDSPSSLFHRIVDTGPKFRIVQDLRDKFSGAGLIPESDRPSTGSRKCDAYLWAKMRYIDTGLCNPSLIGYWCDAFWLSSPEDMSLDNVGLTNHDFVVARKGFICDLNVWSDETPRDDPDQPKGLDCKTFREILLSCFKANGGNMIHFAGFTPWAMKYTTHGNAGGTHDAVPTEWETARIASAYNCYMDADAIGYTGMANASVFSHYPLPHRLIQNPPPTRRDLESKGYIDADGEIAKLNFVYHYLGDYDSAAWIYNRMPEIWSNPVRGQVPSGWAFNPNLIERIPVAFDWFYATKSPVDFFIAGDSGAGYVNPTQLLPPREPSGLESAADAWVEHNTRYYRRLNYSITGFLINGFCGELTDDSNRLFQSFSGDGIMTQLHWMPKEKKHDHLLSGMPVAGMKQDITAPVDVVVEAILKHGRPDQTAFLSFRSILVGPDWIRTVNEAIRTQRPDCRFEPVDPYTYFYLLKHSLGGRIERRATYTFDTMPPRVRKGTAITVSAGIRNDGWETWQSTGADATCLVASFGPRENGVSIPLTRDVEPGGSVVLTFDIEAPEQTGPTDFRLELRTGEDGWFSDSGDLHWQRQVEIF